MAAPMLGLAALAALFVGAQFEDAAKMQRLERFASVSRDVSALIHELQRERGASAGYIGANGDGAFANRLTAQRTRTDRALARFRGAIAGDDTLEDQIAQADRRLQMIASHREAVTALETDMSATVAPYTQAINALISLLSNEISAIDAEGSTGIMVALLNLVQAKENAGIERAVGSNAFSSGAVSLDNHRRAIALQARQQAYFDAFRQMADPRWAGRLDGLLDSAEARAVDDARRVLLAGGYGAPVDAYSGPQWFDLTTSRIDALMALETDLAGELIVTAQDRYAAARGLAWTALATGSSILLLTLALSAAMVWSVVPPLRRATQTLVRIGAGDTQVNVEGVERADEIGALARATQAFLTAARERDAMAERNARLEREASEQRSRMLADMSDQVRRAADSSLSEVSALADTLSGRNSAMRAELERAGREAGHAEAATRENLEQADRAAALAGELSQAIGEVTEQIARGDTLARGAVEKASRTRDQVEALKSAADQISDFVTLISGLAEQTNLLALNATIESARAGEAGKGFAVVASEVKALASQTNTSAEEIAQRVQAIQARTGEAAGSISDIAAAIDSLGEVTGAVSAAMEEQRASAGAFASFVEQNRDALNGLAARIQAVTSVTRAGAEESGAVSDMVSRMADMAGVARTQIPEIINRSIGAAGEGTGKQAV